MTAALPVTAVSTSLTNSHTASTSPPPIETKQEDNPPKWQSTLQSMQEEVTSLLNSVGHDDRVRIDVGRTDIHKDRAVILSWSQKSRLLSSGFNGGLNGSKKEKGEGVLLYLAVRYDDGVEEEDEESEQVQSGDAQDGENALDDDHAKTVQSSDLNNNEPCEGDQQSRIESKLKEVRTIDEEEGSDNEDSRVIDLESSQETEILHLGNDAPDLSLASVALARTAARKWYHNVTLQRGVRAEDVKGMLVEDRFRHLHEIPQDLLLSSILKKSEEDEEETKKQKKKSVRWREILEESNTADDSDACSLVDVHTRCVDKWTYTGRKHYVCLERLYFSLQN